MKIAVLVQLFTVGLEPSLALRLSSQQEQRGREARVGDGSIATTHHSFRGSFSAVSTPIFASK